MKRKILAAVLVLAMCFAFAGCGGDSGDKDKAKEKPKVTSITGSWECEDIEVTDNGKKVSKDTIKTMFGKDFSSVLKLTAYGDGSADINMMGDEGVISWSETEDNGYKLSYTGPEAESAGEMNAKLDGDKLIVTVKETYLSDGKEQGMEMKFTMKYLGKKSKLIEGWDVTLDDDEIYAMSNAMVGGACVEADGMLYGDYGGKEWGKGAFTAAKIKDGKLKDKTVIAKDTKASCLSVYDGDVYGILDKEKIVKVKAGKTKAETLYTGACDYMQVTKNGIYFTDENDKYCKMGFDGKNKETVLDKGVFYPYQVSSKFLIYQDDADGETLHVYNMEDGSDTKISNFVSYEPMLRGDYLYFYTPGNGENMQFMCRVDMYSGKVDKAEGAAIVYDYYVTPKYIAAAKGGFVKIKFSEWDTFSNTSSAGTKAYPVYSNGKTWIAKAYGETYMDTKIFSTEEGKSIGFTYVKEE